MRLMRHLIVKLVLKPLEWTKKYNQILTKMTEKGTDRGIDRGTIFAKKWLFK